MKLNGVYARSIWVPTVQSTRLTSQSLYSLEDVQAVVDCWKENTYGKI